MLNKYSVSLPILFSLFISPISAFAADFETESMLKAATVFADRAALSREAVVEIPAGAHNVIFTGLSANIMTDSLRADGSAVADVTFGALSHKQVIERELTLPREKELNDKIEALNFQRKSIQVEKRALDSKKDFLLSLGQQASLRSNEDIGEIDLKPEQWSAAAESIHTGVAEVMRAELAYNQQITKLDRDINALNAELNQMRTGQRSTYQITLPVEVASKTKLTVSLHYQIGSVTWRPLYDARLDTKSGDLNLVQYGAVRQSTGEDWNDIKLTLSTAQPHRGTSAPALNTMWVNTWDESKNKSRYSNVLSAPGTGAVSGSYRMEEDSMEELAVAAPRAKKAQFRAATINTGGFVSEYVIPGPSSVSSDGTESKLLIGSFETENELQIQVKPQKSTKAFLVSHMELKGEAPILPGAANLFRDGAYIGQTSLPLLRPDEKQDLSFGVDDQVSVKHKVLKDEKGRDGLIAKDNVRERHFVTEIKNLHSQNINLVVLQTAPVGQNEKIKIQILKDKTTAGYKADYDNIKGLMRWNYDLAGKKDKTVNLGWRVEWPKNHGISGL